MKKYIIVVLSLILSFESIQAWTLAVNNKTNFDLVIVPVLISGKKKTFGFRYVIEKGKKEFIYGIGKWTNLDIKRNVGRSAGLKPSVARRIPAFDYIRAYNYDKTYHFSKKLEGFSKINIIVTELDDNSLNLK